MTINTQPEFAPSVRGYNRQQVDDYLQILLKYIDELKPKQPQAHSQAATPNSKMAVAAFQVADPTPAHDGAAFLSYGDDEGRIHRVKLAAPGPYSIGRHSYCDIRLDWDDTVSRLHAWLDLMGGHWILIDDGTSSNGTFVNNRRVRGRQRLSDGDVIRTGLTELAFSAVGGSGAAAQPAPVGFRASSPPPVPTPRAAADRAP